ncbi:MAG TPA: hypothetical protein PKC43_02485 [Phycisphaerales bacterium]|nr:hypothetical protein [Phycisphaerales bacterium]HMP36293.1 hypothetical protein [Phycisphaerales bacterium]
MATSRLEEFAALVRAIRAHPSVESKRALWRAVFGLDAWFFLIDDPEVDPRLMRPRVVERGGRRSVLAFTDELGALRHATRALRPESARSDAGSSAAKEAQRELRSEFATLEVPVHRVLDYCEALAAEGVYGAIFNDGPNRFEAPLARLRELRRAACATAGPGTAAGCSDLERSGGAGRSADSAGSSGSACSSGAPDSGSSTGAAGSDGGDGAGEEPRGCDSIFDACQIEPGSGPGGRSGSACAGIGEILGAFDGSAAAASKAIAALLRLDCWWFICNPRDPESIYVRRFDGLPAVLAFTDERSALDACGRFGLAGDAGEILLLQLDAGDAVQWLGGFRAHDVEVVLFDPLSTPFGIAIDVLRAAADTKPLIE